MARDERYFLGLMSGTSADGVDAALVAVGGAGEAMTARQVRHAFTPYEPGLRQRVLAAGEGEPLTALDLARLDRDVGLAFADAAEAVIAATSIGRGRIAAIGSHGQTIAHDPPAGKGQIGATLQIGSAALVAARTHRPVVSDFRQGDMAAGGQGAPLVAWPDWVLFHHDRWARVLLNLGGIANVTFLPAGGAAAETLAFDTGPGCMVIDALARRLFEQPYDADGAIAAGGKVNHALLNELLADPYFRLDPPKTTGRERWGGPYVHRLMLMAEKHGAAPADVVATATELTARTAAEAILSMTQRPHEVILCGGGARNITLAMRLRQRLSPSSTVGIEKYDIDATAKEAVSFALLAAARLDGVPANIPQATGASGPALLGTVTGAGGRP